MATAPTPTQQRAEQLAATLPPLMVAADRVASTVSQGVHGRRRVGQGEAFWQFRQYYPGDSAQIIDWRQSAKTQRVFIRENEWEAAQSVWLWRDGSASMDFRSAPSLPKKRDRAELLTLALASLLLRGGEHVGLLGGSLTPARGRNALLRLTLELPPAGPNEPSLPPFQMLPRHAHLILIGDFLEPLERLDAVVRRFAELGVKGHLLLVLDPAEESFPYTGRGRFEGLEDDGDILIRRSESIRDQYVDILARHVVGLAALARATDWSFTSHRTDRPAEAALLALYTSLSAPRRF